MFLNLLILIIFLFLLIFSISKWKVHPFIALLLIAIALGISLGLGGKQTVEMVLTGFSETLRWVAIIIILGAFIGEVLQETGAAIRISKSILKWTGEKKLPWAMGLAGYIISIPVFVDVAYILLQPVVESLAVKSKKPVLYIGLALTAGLTVSHTFIPPNPGPVAMVSLLHLNMGRMLLINVIVSIFALVGSVLWVIFFVKRSWIGYDKKLGEAIHVVEDHLSVETSSVHTNLFFDVLPILTPIILIGLGAIVHFENTTFAGKIFNFICLPLVSVLIGAIIAVFQLKNPGKQRTINKLVEHAIVKSAVVIMIIGAGGALGYVIRDAGIQNEVAHVFSDFPFLGFMLPFLVASVLTTATGSITVSMVATASIVAPLLNSLPVSPEMVAALIGCGSFCVLLANASFFWLLNRLHEVPPNILYKTYTIQSLIMGLSGLIGVLVLKMVGF